MSSPKRPVREYLGEYYGYLSRLIDDEADGKTKLEFEIVRKDQMTQICVDVGVDMSGRSTNIYQRIFQPYYGFFYLTVTLSDSAEASPKGSETYQPGIWYMIKLGDYGEHGCVLENPFDERFSMSLSCRIDTADEEFAYLNHAFTIQGSEPPDHPEFLSTSHGLIVRTYYVGAALCVGILTDGDVLAYFDLGCIPGSSSTNEVVRQRASRAANNRTAILDSLQDNPQKTIMISHWHRDHINILFHCNRANTILYDEFWSQSVWHVPASNSPSAYWVRSQMPNNDNFHVYRGVRHPALPTRQQPIQIGKISPFYSARNITFTHPHHHGLYTLVRLNGDRTVLLSGDCTYAWIPRGIRNNHHFLQASHHGGNYALHTTDSDLRISSIPQTESAGAQVVYSANGVTHGHPKAPVKNEHNGNGWRDAVTTGDLADGRGRGKKVVPYLDWQ